MKKAFLLVIFLICADIFAIVDSSSPINSECASSPLEGNTSILYDTTEFSPTDDAYLQGSTRYNNSLIRLEQGNRTGYLKFNLGTINGTITKVELSLRISTDSGNGTITVFNGDNSSWTENTLTTSNAPSEVSTLGSRGASGSLHIFDLSLANSQIYSGNLSLILKHTGTDDLAYASSENASTTIRPKLIVTYTPGTTDTTPPTAPTLVSSGQTQTTADLSWSGATDNVGVTGYKLFQDGTEIPGIGNVTSYQVTGLTAQNTYNFTVKAIDAQGNESPNSNSVAVTTDAPAQGSSFFINVGGPALSHDGKQFSADQYASGGTSWTNTNAQVPALYQTERSGTARTFDYNVPLNSGTYDVSLHFAEIWWGATGGGTGGVGNRIFDVTLEGNQVLNNYDIFADVGTETPVVKTFNVTITDGTLNFNFSSLPSVGGVDQAKLSALEIVPASPSTSGAWVSNGDDIYFSGGNVGIGTTIPDYDLTIKGKIHTEEVRIDLAVPGPDYVFKTNYNLRPLKEVQNYIKENGHLPNIPSALEMETNGVELGTMEMKLLEKIEEITLYVLQQKKRLERLQVRNESLQDQLSQLENLKILEPRIQNLKETN